MKKDPSGNRRGPNKINSLVYLLDLQIRRVMPSLTNGKNISIHFTEEELPLPDEFEQYRKQN